MEYPRVAYSYEKSEGSGDTVAGQKYFLWSGKFFTPDPSSESVIADRLKGAKLDLMKEQRGESVTGQVAA